jgi:gas vesicle protein
MSDMLKEKFEEFVTEAGLVVEAGDPMPTVSAAVIPGGGSAPASQSKTEVNSKAGAGEGQGTVGTDAVNGYGAQQSVTDNGGPRPDGNDAGEDNPGAKASAPVGAKGAQSDGTAQTSSINDAGDQGKTVTVGADVAYATSTGPDVSYPIKPSFESLDMSADVAALTEGTELTEEFKEKATTIFEAAVKSKLAEEWAKLEEQFETRVSEQVTSVKAELAEEVGGTIKYAVKAWLEENQVSIDRGIRNEITEDFIAGLKNLFQEHYINIPDDKVDVVEGMSEDIRKMEDSLNEQIERNVKLQGRLDESAKTVILNVISEGLADTQKDKLASLAEGVEFESEEKFAEKVKTLRESYFPANPASPAVEATDEAPVEGEEVSPAMAQYLNAINRWNS